MVEREEEILIVRIVCVAVQLAEALYLLAILHHGVVLKEPIFGLHLVGAIYIARLGIGAACGAAVVHVVVLMLCVGSQVSGYLLHGVLPLLHLHESVYVCTNLR